MKAKKVLSVFLALILAISMLAGCGGGTATSETEKNFSETDEKLTLEWLGYPILPGCDEGTEVELLLEEEFNVDIKPLFYEEVKFNDKKTMLMAGGEIPDLIYELDPVNVFNDVDQDFIVELPYGTIKKYAPTYYQYLSEIAPAAWSYSRYMDANWGLPNINYFNNISKTYGYRTDWLDAVGMEAPTTLEEMHDVLDAFVHNDPDGNGEDDTFGYITIANHYHWFFPDIFGAYGLLPFDWQEVDGEIVYGGLREECTEVMQLLQDWYKEGLIHPDFISGTNINKYGPQNKVGFYPEISLQDDKNPTSHISTVRERIPEADYTYVSAPYGPDGLRGMRVWGYPCHVVSFGNTEQYGVAVPRMLQMIEGMFTDDELATTVNLGIEGKHWEKVLDENSNEKAIYKFKDKYTDSAARRLEGICVQLNGPSFFMPVAPKKEVYMDNMTPNYRKWIETYAPADAALTDVFYKVDIVPSAADYLGDLRNKQMALMAEIIFGEKPAESYLSEFGEMWSKGGGDIMIEEAKAQNEVIEDIYKDIGIK